MAHVLRCTNIPRLGAETMLCKSGIWMWSPPLRFSDFLLSCAVVSSFLSVQRLQWYLPSAQPNLLRHLMLCQPCPASLRSDLPSANCGPKAECNNSTKSMVVRKSIYVSPVGYAEDLEGRIGFFKKFNDFAAEWVSKQSFSPLEKASKLKWLTRCHSLHRGSDVSAFWGLCCTFKIKAFAVHAYYSSVLPKNCLTVVILIAVSGSPFVVTSDVLFLSQPS